MEYIERQPNMATTDKLKRLQERYAECQRELGYYKAQNERLKQRIAELQDKCRRASNEG